MSFPVDHPSAAGHFPGNPIVPGALLLAHVTRAVADSQDRATAPVTIRSAKFLRPVRPGETVTLAWTEAVNHEIRFECSLDRSGEKVMAGALVFGDDPC